ncbi:MAG: outer membrane protein transport protein [candidate division WOR-3 bacterium]
MVPAQARMEGDLEMDIGWPQSVKVGVFWTMSFLGGTVIAFDVEWLDWSHYYDSIPVRLRHVTMNGTPQSDQTFRMDLKWKDQWVFKLGFEYPVTESLALRMGYVYGKNPVSSSQGVLAVMNPFVEHHLTGGLGYSIGEKYEVNLAVVYGISQYERVGNKNNFAPDMQNSRTGMEFLSAAAMMSYRF